MNAAENSSKDLAKTGKIFPLENWIQNSRIDTDDICLPNYLLFSVSSFPFKNRRKPKGDQA